MVDVCERMANLEGLLKGLREAITIRARPPRCWWRTIGGQSRGDSMALERDRALFDLAPRPKQPGFGRHLLAEHPYNRLWATVNDGQQDAGGANRRRVARWELANTRHTPRRGRTTTPRPTPTGQPALDRCLYICKCQ